MSVPLVLLWNSERTTSVESVLSRHMRFPESVSKATQTPFSLRPCVWWSERRLKDSGSQVLGSTCSSYKNCWSNSNYLHDA